MNRFNAACLSATSELIFARLTAAYLITIVMLASFCTDVNGQLSQEATTLTDVSSPVAVPPKPDIPGLTDAELRRVLDFQQHRIDAIDQVVRSVVAIYGDDRSGGGSGVVITPTGLALTNHHVIIGAGVEGWGGMAGDKMYRWKLIGTDPGGDVSLIQLLPNDDDVDIDQADGESESAQNGDGKKTGIGKAEDVHAGTSVSGVESTNATAATNVTAAKDRQDRFEFPYTPLGDSDTVQVGDWALAMGNPFILTEDQSPTVTLGIVSGINRYQSGAGQNQLVYGNCIQVDSSINPGNSGGPLFNFSGEVIGINGRGSFQDRGRVNVGLGYAISANQIKNFVPELLATKLVEHGTLDANFSDRGGKVVCSTLSVDSPVAQAGLELGDEMLAFENKTITTANQFTNLICTLPEGWPARLKIRKSSGQTLDLSVRLLGLPYSRPPQSQRRQPAKKKPPKDSSPPPNEQQKAEQRKLEMVKLLSADPGTVRDPNANGQYADLLIGQWRTSAPATPPPRCWKLEDSITSPDKDAAPRSMTTWISTDGRFKVETEEGNWHFDGHDFFESLPHQQPEQQPGTPKKITPLEAKEQLEVLQAIAISAAFPKPAFSGLGDVLIDGADLSNGQLAWRLVIGDKDNGPLYAWFDGTMFSNRQLRLSKVSTDIDCLQGGVLLSDWRVVTDADGWALAMTRQNVFGLSEEVRETIANVGISEITLSNFESLLSDRASESAGSNE